MFRKLLLIAALLATDVIVFGAILSLVNVGKADLHVKMLSAILAHWYLACFWLSFGAMKAPGRQFACTSLLALVCLFTSSLDGDPMTAIARSLLIIAVTWFFYAAIFFPRRLAGLRIGFADRNRERATKRQFGLGVLLGFTVVVAIPLALSRLSLAINPKIANELYLTTLLFAPVCATALPLSISIFASRHGLLKVSLSLGWCLLATFAVRQFTGVDGELSAPILALIWIQVALNLCAARFVGLRWEDAPTELEVQPAVRGYFPRNTIWLQAKRVALQLFLLALAAGAGWMLIFAPESLQFVATFVLVAATPLLILGALLWRRTRPSAFWIGALLSGIIPWAYAMIVTSREVYVLLWGKPFLTNTSPAQITPSTGIDWVELLMILLAPLVIGSLGGGASVLLKSGLARNRRAKPIATPP